MLKGLRRREKGGKAICYLHSYIAPRAGKFVRELKRCVGPFYAHLAKRTGEDILEVEQDIFGTPMTAEIAGHLKCKSRHDRDVRVPPLHHAEGTLIASYNWHVAESFTIA